jgi:nitroreductase
MIGHAELHELMASRRSVRRFRAELPARELVERIIESAVTAPSASNRQPWRFTIVTSRVTIDALATAVQAAVDRIALAIEPEFAAPFHAYGGYFRRFEAAPMVIVPLFRAIMTLSNLTGSRLGEDDRIRIAAMERDSGLIGTSLALQNLLLAAHAAGLAASAMTGPLVAVDDLRSMLRVSPSWHIAALVPIGYADETPDAPARKIGRQVTEWLD